MTNEIIGNYRIEEKIGGGGYSRVYWASHIWNRKKVVAIKIFHEYVDTLSARAKFESEARLLRQLRHEHIVPIIAHGIKYMKSHEAYLPYLITELAPEGSLRDLLNETDGPLPKRQALLIITQVGEALQYAHDNDVAHLDIKPENILFKAPDHVWLADLGIADVLVSTRTREGGIAGTYAYMAPEQFQGKMSKRSDQYALACVTYELLTGKHPFNTTSSHSLMYQHLETQPISPNTHNPEIPDAVCKVILKGMAKDRYDRYPTTADFVKMLKLAFRTGNWRARDEYPAAPQAPARLSNQPPITRRASRIYQPEQNQRPAYQAPPAQRIENRAQHINNQIVRNRPARYPPAHPVRSNSRRLPRQPPRSRIQEFISQPQFLSVQPSTYLRQHYSQGQSQHKNWIKASYIWLAPLMFVMALIVYLLSLMIPSFPYTLPVQIIDCLCLFCCLTGDAAVEVYRDGHPYWNALAIITFVCEIGGILIAWQQQAIFYFFVSLLPMTLLSIFYRWRQSNKG
ncbi:serine/threonine protein kinase [Dictyobacter aurantiacus]|uniref:non-specific serine/threonine protein kinase n=1 Tax=Dictyobacter aurantiacus TaxID=1936993 RepID=A0A401ZN71_9CHLR|nr:serine/threonine-protein kinase [Dictyobacter aurantiacus]GCE08311.1 hypothetical protein KDAU_56400 [Dictyobacter aurantiacus]